MKQGWTYKNLGEVFSSINNGANIKQIKGATGIPITRIETLSNDKFNRDRMGYANIENVTPYASYVLNEGDILMSHINSMKFLGRSVAYSKKGDETIIHGMNLLRLVPTSNVLSRFMIYQFQTRYFKDQILQISHQSVNQASFNITNLKGLNIKVPSLSEQERIVERLDAAFAQIDELKSNAEKQLAEARALFQSALTQAMQPKPGWQERTLKDCINKIPKQKQVKSKDYQPSGKYPIVSQERDIISGYWDDDSFLYKHERPVIIFGDHTKEIKYIDFDFVVGADGTQILSPKDGLVAKFFYYALLATPIRNLGYARHFKLLKEVLFYVPQMAEQQCVVEYLDTLSNHVKELEETSRKTAAECDALKQALLRQIFE